MVNMFLKEKRGISPLIATVLIIGFTVALAAIIITWGGGFIQKTQEDVSTRTDFALTCSNLNFEIASVGCAGGSLNSITVKSNSDATITGLVARVTDDVSGDVDVFNSALVPATLTMVPGSITRFNSAVATLVPADPNPDFIEVFAMIDNAEGNPQACQAGSKTYAIGADDANC